VKRSITTNVWVLNKSWRIQQRKNGAAKTAIDARIVSRLKTRKPCWIARIATLHSTWSASRQFISSQFLRTSHLKNWYKSEKRVAKLACSSAKIASCVKAADQKRLENQDRIGGLKISSIVLPAISDGSKINIVQSANASGTKIAKETLMRSWFSANVISGFTKVVIECWPQTISSDLAATWLTTVQYVESKRE